VNLEKFQGTTQNTTEKLLILNLCPVDPMKQKEGAEEAIHNTTKRILIRPPEPIEN